MARSTRNGDHAAMPHVHRFYAPPGAMSEGAVVLRDEEAHHALHVVRVRLGDPVEVFDGCGCAWDGAVAAASRKEVTVSLRAERRIPPPATRLTLVQGWLHRDRSVEELIRRGTEIGVARFVFFQAAHSERGPRPSIKWTRWAVESCKQCGRLWIPEFLVAESLETAVAEAEGTVLIATKDVPPIPLRDALKGSTVAVVVGPEGNFTAEEIACAVGRGAAPLSLGEVNFRSEVAAILACTLVQYELGQLGPQIEPAHDSDP